MSDTSPWLPSHILCLRGQRGSYPHARAAMRSRIWSEAGRERDGMFPQVQHLPLAERLSLCSISSSYFHTTQQNCPVVSKCWLRPYSIVPDQVILCSESCCRSGKLWLKSGTGISEVNASFARNSLRHPLPFWLAEAFLSFYSGLCVPSLPLWASSFNELNITGTWKFMPWKSADVWSWVRSVILYPAIEQTQQQWSHSLCFNLTYCFQFHLSHRTRRRKDV